MSKTESDELRKINTSFLKEHKYFQGEYKGGTITWTSGWSQNKNSVSIEVSTLDSYLRIYYTQTDKYTQEKKDFDYKVPLTTTPCNYGGKRYWFICPLYKGGNYCGKRVGTLYKDGDYFGCRHCYDLTYSSRKLSGIQKVFGSISNIEVEKAREKVKITHYKGRPTRNYLGYLKKVEKLDNALLGMAYTLNKAGEVVGI